MFTDIVGKIEGMLKRRGTNVAVRFDGIEYTYEELDFLSSRIASFLQINEICEENIVAVYMDRSWLSVCTIIGIMRSGAAFLPIEKKTHFDRVLQILEISKPKMVISDTELRLDVDLSFVHINQIMSKPNKKLKKVKITASSLAYVIFTSGSTGEPKGVMIEYGGLSNHVLEKIRILNLGEESIIAHNASIGFDISIWQIIAPLYVGGKIVIFTDDMIFHLKKFVQVLVEERITVLEVVPTYLNLLIKECKKSELLSDLQYIISTGQELKREIVNRWLLKFPDIPIVNAYGPTEASDDIAHCVITKNDTYDRIPIGIPIDNVKFSINYECNSDTIGELWVSGICVGRGYIGNEEETKKSFFINIDNGSRIYKTGDLVSLTVDGQYVYHGRKDGQIKVHGNRVEIEEIENAIISFHGIDDVAVVYSREKDEIYAVFVATPLVDIGKVKEFLYSKLPSYMVPMKYIQVHKIPVHLNGKTDNKKVLEMFETGDSYDEKAVHDIISGIMQIQEFPEDNAWRDDLSILGLDSLAVIRLIVEIEAIYGIEFEDEYLRPEIIFNFNKLCDYIKKKKFT